MPANRTMNFRHKPTVVQAEQFFHDKPLPFRRSGSPVMLGCECGPNACCSLCGKYWIDTLEGPHIVTDGDWIIRGTKGEFYACKPHIFPDIYEPESESHAS